MAADTRNGTGSWLAGALAHTLRWDQASGDRPRRGSSWSQRASSRSVLSRLERENAAEADRADQALETQALKELAPANW